MCCHQKTLSDGICTVLVHLLSFTDRRLYNVMQNYSKKVATKDGLPLIGSGIVTYFLFCIHLLFLLLFDETIFICCLHIISHFLTMFIWKYQTPTFGQSSLLYKFVVILDKLLQFKTMVGRKSCLNHLLFDPLWKLRGGGSQSNVWVKLSIQRRSQNVAYLWQWAT